jgi:Reverse transcriptase (RNA-dependent DNA polymerase)
MRRGCTRPAGRTDEGGPRVFPIPKPRGGTRWLTELDPAGDADLRRAVRPLAGRIERSLGSEVLAIRAARRGEDWSLAPWVGARAAWRRRVRRAIRMATPGTTFAIADILDCYASISPDTIGALLGSEAAHAVALLRRFHEHGVRGLPVGPEPSAILANAVLARIDDAIRAHGIPHLRWVDDIVLRGPSHDVRTAMSALDAAATAVGLQLHPRKTRILEDRDEAAVVLLGDRDSSIIATPCGPSTAHRAS